MEYWNDGKLQEWEKIKGFKPNIPIFQHSNIPTFQYSASDLKGFSLSEFFKWLIVGWSLVVVGIAALGTILIIKYGEVKKIETDDVSLCFIIAFFCWLIPIIAFTILARTLGF